MKKQKILSFLILLLFSACSQRTEITYQGSNISEPTQIQGYIVPMDSISMPKQTEVDFNDLTKKPIGKPLVSFTNSHIHLAGNPGTILSESPKINTAGQNGFLFPEKKQITGLSVIAYAPEIVVVKDAYMKEENLGNFSSYSKLQGLKHDVIRCITHDNNGNLWLGTDGGVCRYDGKYFSHYTDKTGLSNNRVSCILFDPVGNLWIGTMGGGVTKYDGKEFTHYTEKQGFISDMLNCILKDSKGNIWFGTTGGVCKYDGFSFITYTEKEGLGNNNVISIFEDRDGNIWFGAEKGIITFFNGIAFANFSFKNSENWDRINAIAEDKYGNLWFGTSAKGVYKLENRANVQGGVKFLHFTEKEGLSNNFILNITVDKKGDLWFCTDGGGIMKYDGKSFTCFTEKEGLGNNKVFNMLIDKNAVHWLCTDGGLNKFDGNSFSHYTNKEGLAGNRVYAIIEDNHKNIWLGTINGGISNLSWNYHSIATGKNSFSSYTAKEGLSNNQVFCAYQDKSGNIWFGTYGAGITILDKDKTYFRYFSKEDGLNSNRIFDIFQDENENIWLCTDEGVSKYDGRFLTTFTKNEGLSDNWVYSALQDRNGNIWFGTASGGITRLDGKALREGSGYHFTHYTEKEGITNNNILSMTEDDSGKLWFGTYGGGVLKYDRKYFTKYSEKDGLCSDYVFSVLADKKGNVWFGTRFGLSVLEQKKPGSKTNAPGMPLFKNYTYEDGFLGIGCIRNSILEDNTGKIWIGANDRLTVFHPDGATSDTLPPVVQVIGITLFNEKIDWKSLEHSKDTSFVLSNGIKVGNFSFDGISEWYGLPENLSLAYNNNYLSFSFVGITTRSPQKVKYQYKLDGIEEQWSTITTRNEANYGNLPFGSYTFRLKAMNSEGYWSKEFNYKFTIRPPWWKTWWFRIIEFIALLLTIFIYIKWRERKLKRDKAMLERKVKEQTLELSEKNEELISQNEEIESQKNIIENKNKKITDSIRYARNIQHAILPVKEKLNRLLKDHFIFYQPKDIVSGDFYWAENYTNPEDETITLFAAVDCTGHGVPGAFMSLLGYNGLSQAVKENRLSKPGDILNFLSNYIQETLRQRNDECYVKDGMDLFLCALNRKNMSLQYAGVHNSACLIRNGELFILNPDKHPIAEPFSAEFSSYTNNQQAVTPGDVIYLFTDGFIDQFGGKDRKKFLSKRFRELLLTIHTLGMAEQHAKLSTAFDHWKGNNEQYDDVLIIGIKV